MTDMMTCCMLSAVLQGRAGKYSILTLEERLNKIQYKGTFGKARPRGTRTQVEKTVCVDQAGTAKESTVV